MERIEFEHGGAEYDAHYPDGIPTSLELTHRRHGTFRGGLVMYPLGHARNQSDQLAALLDHKFDLLAALGVEDHRPLRDHLDQLDQLSPDEVRDLYSFAISGVTDDLSRVGGAP